jgi:8-amino-7-oxononanoate synthase
LGRAISKLYFFVFFSEKIFSQSIKMNGSVVDFLEKRWQKQLEDRQAQGLLRTLQSPAGRIDFYSNDYLGLARSEVLRVQIAEVQARFFPHIPPDWGATGSRLLAGNTDFAEDLEAFIAQFHGAEAGLLFNSGYEANLGVLSTLPQPNDYLLCDELMHASMIDGARLSKANRLIFRHNDLEDLARQLQNIQPMLRSEATVWVAVESVYSMDGDQAPLPQLAEICAQYQAHLIVDEAHATGVFGPCGEGLVAALGLAQQVAVRVVTFGKALGCHGAIVLGSQTLRRFLINHARSFIYTTAAPLHSLVAVRAAYECLIFQKISNKNLQHLIAYYRDQSQRNETLGIVLDSHSAIQGVLVSGQSACRQLAAHVQLAGFDVRPIVWPTVPKGQERIRLCLHDFNTAVEIDELLTTLFSYFIPNHS